MAKVGSEVPEMCQRTDRQTDRQTGVLITMFRSHTEGGVFKVVATESNVQTRTPAKLLKRQAKVEARCKLMIGEDVLPEGDRTVPASNDLRNAVSDHGRSDLHVAGGRPGAQLIFFWGEGVTRCETVKVQDLKCWNSKHRRSI